MKYRQVRAWAIITYRTFRAALEIAVPLVAAATIFVALLTIHMIGKAH